MSGSPETEPRSQERDPHRPEAFEPPPFVERVLSSAATLTGWIAVLLYVLGRRAVFAMLSKHARHVTAGQPAVHIASIITMVKEAQEGNYSGLLRLANARHAELGILERMQRQMQFVWQSLVVSLLRSFEHGTGHETTPEERTEWMAFWRHLGLQMGIDQAMMVGSLETHEMQLRGTAQVTPIPDGAKEQADLVLGSPELADLLAAAGLEADRALALFRDAELVPPQLLAQYELAA